MTPEQRKQIHEWFDSLMDEAKTTVQKSYATQNDDERSEDQGND
jgi:hypothetical protein